MLNSFKVFISGQCYFAREIERGGYQRGSKKPKCPRPLCKFAKCASVCCSLLFLSMAADATAASPLPSPHRPLLHLPSTKDVAMVGKAMAARQRRRGNKAKAAAVGSHGKGEERAAAVAHFANL